MTVGSQSSASGKRRRTQPGWLALLVAVVLAFAWQSFVAQTHHHLAFGTASATASAKAEGDGPTQPGKHSPSDLPAHCSICRAAAHAGPVMLPAPIELAVPAQAAIWLAVARLPGLTLARRSHAWQSRAPPQQLQG